MSEKKSEFNLQANQLTPDKLEAFLEEIFRKDQNSGDRQNAMTCYQELKSKESSFLGTEFEKDYFNALSLELMHMGQYELLHMDQTTKAISYFEQALEASKLGISTEWQKYLEGTLHYLNNDRNGLEKTIQSNADNKDVLERLLVGLKTRGFPNYKEDY